MAATPEERARGLVRRFNGPCDYVYRAERDETAYLLEYLAGATTRMQAQIQTFRERLALLPDAEKKISEMTELISNLELEVQNNQDTIKSSSEKIEKIRKVQKTYVKFARRNLTTFQTFVEGSLRDELGTSVHINSDNFEEAVTTLYQLLPESTAIEFITHQGEDVAGFTEKFRLLNFNESP